METGDLNGAEQMLKSSFQIAKGIYDSPAMVVSLNGMKTLLLNSGQASQAAENHDYTHRKAAEVNQAYATAIAKPDHANILKYANSLSAGPSAV